MIELDDIFEAAYHDERQKLAEDKAAFLANNPANKKEEIMLEDWKETLPDRRRALLVVGDGPDAVRHAFLERVAEDFPSRKGKYSSDPVDSLVRDNYWAEMRALFEEYYHDEIAANRAGKAALELLRSPDLAEKTAEVIGRYLAHLNENDTMLGQEPDLLDGWEEADHPTLVGVYILSCILKKLGVKHIENKGPLLRFLLLLLGSEIRSVKSIRGNQLYKRLTIIHIDDVINGKDKNLSKALLEAIKDAIPKMEAIVKSLNGTGSFESLPNEMRADLAYLEEKLEKKVK